MSIDDLGFQSDAKDVNLGLRLDDYEDFLYEDDSESDRDDFDQRSLPSNGISESDTSRSEIINDIRSENDPFEPDLPFDSSIVANGMVFIESCSFESLFCFRSIRLSSGRKSATSF